MVIRIHMEITARREEIYFAWQQGRYFQAFPEHASGRQALPVLAVDEFEGREGGAPSTL
jgi:hypothetical protein